MRIKVMTFNLRHPLAEDGRNAFQNREEKILAAIQSQNPDLIGFQEETDYSRAFLKRVLSDYVLLGCGREAHYHGETCSIAFKKELFEVISFETKWLSYAPNTENSFYDGTDQSRYPRYYVHAELTFGESGKRLHFYNTHFDHKGSVARMLGMTQILQSISACDAPVVLTGDMNERPGGPAVLLPLQVKSKQIKDATTSITHTFNGFGRFEEGVKIDYIYTDAAFFDTHTVADPHEDGVYLSDHAPVCTTIEIES